MNVEELLNLAHLVIQRDKKIHGGPLRLIIRKGELICVPTDNHQTEDIQIWNLTAIQKHHGFSTNEWNNLGQKLSIIYKELKL